MNLIKKIRDFIDNHFLYANPRYIELSNNYNESLIKLKSEFRRANYWRDRYNQVIRVTVPVLRDYKVEEIAECNLVKYHINISPLINRLIIDFSQFNTSYDFEKIKEVIELRLQDSLAEQDREIIRGIISQYKDLYDYRIQQS